MATETIDRSKQRNRKVRIRVVHDEYTESPRKEECNVGTMICWHRRYELGDKHDFDDQFEMKRRLAFEECPRLEQIVEEWENKLWYCGFDERADADEINEHIGNLIQAVLDAKFVILPLYLYDHSGLVMNATGFTCPWDSGQVGFIYARKEDAYEKIGVKDDETITESLKIEVDVYSSFIGGECYGFIIEKLEDGEWIESDSCYGFIGMDHELNGLKEHIPEELQDLLPRYGASD